ncbi:P-loop containing nucleoside triphosphate hydrolase protein [Periconia macrospinosa]|uniref:P-loop containing nucleoside triphosphate hydrolase protein n=1 Tax=Periconia macrospinosa TaxID=97972 RepID=A0A2V1DR85_9PLEO|nr:P-loop containing nucleoside triphosphate hydrolase protein [Periconia macrospinosa]
MASKEGRERLAQIGKQITTDGPHNVFDASQFKLLVENDVPASVIEKLQKEFGNNMSGAIDKFRETEKKRTTKAEPEIDPKNAGEENEEAQKEVEIDNLGRKPFVIRDRYWDKNKRQWVIQKPTKKKGGSKKYKNCVIFVRRDYDEDMLSFTTALIISGLVLRNALRNIFRGAAGFGLTENETTEMTPNFMFWARSELEMLAEHYQNVNDKQATFEINAALKFIESEYEDMIPVLPSLLPNSITFEYLWAIFPPDCLVVSTHPLGFERISCARSHSVQRIEGVIYRVLNCEYLAWDGAKAGYMSQTLMVPIYQGVKLISELPCIPLQYHPRRDAIIEEVLKRSSKALEYWQPGYKHEEHHGTGLAQVYDKVEPYPFSSRVMIDPKMMQQMAPANKVFAGLTALSSIRTASRVCFSDMTSKEEHPKILEALLKEASSDSTKIEGRRRRPWEMRHTGENDDGGLTSSDSSSSVPELSEEQMLIVSGLLYGYSLREGKWGAFAVDRVSPIEWNGTIFDSLVMDATLKDTIFRLVTAHSQESSTFDDFVKGKGKGLVGLFYGPPGAGKTLTAEAIAETTQLPLYSVSSGALGHEASKIHANLAVILALASHWKAVLLLDEADVFLAQRTITDIERNAIVSIFLRELEYYQGILLMTTNQVEVIDEAFQSRIHISLQYPGLDAAARLKIWQNFIINARKSGAVDVEVTEKELSNLAEIPLNGRQIKNAVSIAIKIASTRTSYAITADRLKETVKLSHNSRMKLSQ